MESSIGFFISSFGSAGIFIWYLINKEKTTDNAQTEAIRQNTLAIEKTGRKTREAIDDLTISVQDLLDAIIPSHSGKRRSKNLRLKIKETKDEK